MMVTLIGGIAEVEAANTSTRVASLWDYTRSQDAWFIGKPAYGYVTTKANGRPSLPIEPNAHKALHWPARRMTLRGVSARRVSLCPVRSGLMSEGLTTTTLLRRLRSPALMGYRVEENKNRGLRRSKLILGHDGKPVGVAEPIFTKDEYNELREAIDRLGKIQPQRQTHGATQLLGVLVCADCTSNMTVHVASNMFGQYRYLR